MAKTKTYRFCGKDLVLGKTVALKNGKNPPKALIEETAYGGTKDYTLILYIPGIDDMYFSGPTPRGAIGKANRWLVETGELLLDLWSRA